MLAESNYLISVWIVETLAEILRSLGLDESHEDVLGVHQLVLVQYVMFNCRADTDLD